MARHSVLFRQLNHLKLSEAELPATLEQWQQFLDSINRTYTEHDQERRQMERTQGIASREMQELYSELHDAQAIAHLGNWAYDLLTGKITGSDETACILGHDLVLPQPTFAELQELIYPDDRSHFAALVQEAIQHGKDFETELRFLVNKQIRWINIIAKAIRNKANNSIVKIYGTMLDITQRKEIELRQRMEHNILRVLIQADSLSLASMAKQVLQIICETFNWELGVFWNWDAKQQLLIRQGVWGKNPVVEALYLKSIPADTCMPDKHFLIKNIWQTRQAYWMDISQENIPAYHDFVSKLDIHGVFAFLVKTKNEPLLVFDFFSASDKEFDQAALQNINSISNQIGLFVEQKQAQEREKALDKQLVVAARRAGMAEVATSVLHNVGNVLNSVNVSATLLKEKIQASKLLEGFIEVNKQLKLHQQDFINYLTDDPQGQRLPEYLILLETALKDNQDNAKHELDLLMDNIQHIKEIVTMQQALGGALGVLEPVAIAEQMEAAVAMTGFDSSYTIERRYEMKDPIILDRVKLMQILVNLIRNAKDALMASDQKPKKLILTVERKSSEVVAIQVRDNGIGIMPENITRIFAFGFTTKKKGHGFGLHISALLAEEMDGNLKAESTGIGQGATFTLELPINILQPGKQ